MEILSESLRQEGRGGDTLQSTRQIKWHSQSLLELISILQVKKMYLLLCSVDL